MKGTRRILLIVAVLLGIALASFGVAYAITDGQLDGNAHPYVGLVVFDDADGPAWFCSGALLSPTVFLTAGHCTDGAVAARVWFDSEITDPLWPLGGGTSVEATQIIPHPKYRWGPTSNPHDVGVLILEPGVTVTEFANLPSEGFLDQLRGEGKLGKGRDRANFTVVGYGATLDWPPRAIGAPDRQRRSAVSEYLKLLKAWLVMSQNQAPGRGDGGTCSGDSGGPAFWTEPDETEILVGITSWGDTRCAATGLNYRVDIPETLSFICSKPDVVCP